MLSILSLPPGADVQLSILSLPSGADVQLSSGSSTEISLIEGSTDRDRVRVCLTLLTDDTLLERDVTVQVNSIQESKNIDDNSESMVTIFSLTP